MKKMLVLALAFVAFAGQAHAAGPEGKEKAEAIKKEIVRKAQEDARRANHARVGSSTFAAEISSSRIGGTLGGNAAHEIAKAESNPLLKAEIVKIISSTDHKQDSLNKARLEAMAHVANLDPRVLNLDKKIEETLSVGEKAKEADLIAQQNYASLVLSAGKQAAGWPEATQKNMTQFLEIANDAIASGKSVSEALNFAKSELKRLAKVDIKIEDIRKLCKLA